MSCTQTAQRMHFNFISKNGSRVLYLYTKKEVCTMHRNYTVKLLIGYVLTCFGAYVTILAIHARAGRR